MSFNDLQVSFEQIYYTLAKKPDKLFLDKTEDSGFCICGKAIWKVERFCVIIVQNP